MYLQKNCGMLLLCGPKHEHANFLICINIMIVFVVNSLQEEHVESQCPYM
jgi:hypothetical protein